MVDRDLHPDAGGNTDQPDDGRDADGRLPEPLDSAHYPPVEGGPAVNVPGMPLSQPAGTGPVVSTPPPPPPNDEADGEGVEEEAGYETWTNAELEEELTRRGLPKTGNKAEMVARLVENDAAAPAPPAEAAPPAGGMTTMPRAGG